MLYIIDHVRAAFQHQHPSYRIQQDFSHPPGFLVLGIRLILLVVDQETKPLVSSTQAGGRTAHRKTMDVFEKMRRFLALGVTHTQGFSTPKPDRAAVGAARPPLSTVRRPEAPFIDTRVDLHLIFGSRYLFMGHSVNERTCPLFLSFKKAPIILQRTVN